MSVDSILQQSLKPFEIHFIQDGPINSELQTIINDYLSSHSNIIHIKLKKSNLAKALNESIKLTKTKYYARMDSDDISMPDRLKTQYDFFL